MSGFPPIPHAFRRCVRIGCVEGKALTHPEDWHCYLCGKSKDHPNHATVTEKPEEKAA